MQRQAAGTAAPLNCAVLPTAAASMLMRAVLAGCLPNAGEIGPPHASRPDAQPSPPPVPNTSQPSRGPSGRGRARSRGGGSAHAQSGRKAKRNRSEVHKTREVSGRVEDTTTNEIGFPRQDAPAKQRKKQATAGMTGKIPKATGIHSPMRGITQYFGRGLRRAAAIGKFLATPAPTLTTNSQGPPPSRGPRNHHEAAAVPEGKYQDAASARSGPLEPPAHTGHSTPPRFRRSLRFDDSRPLDGPGSGSPGGAITRGHSRSRSRSRSRLRDSQIERTRLRTEPL